MYVDIFAFFVSAKELNGGKGSVSKKAGVYYNRKLDSIYFMCLSHLETP